MSSKVFVPSIQQQAVFDWAVSDRGNAFIEAVAGSGKTTTLVQLCSRVIPLLEKPFQKVAFVAYNKKIAEEIARKISEHDKEAGTSIARKVDSGTFHSFGLRAWKQAHPEVEIDGNKKWEQLLEVVAVPEEMVSFVKAAVSMAKQKAIGLKLKISSRQQWRDMVDHFGLELSLEDPTLLEKAIDWSIVCLEKSNEMSKRIIDFDDMIYMPVITNIKIWTYSWVMVDEAQDTNPARRELARKMTDPRWSRAVFVGDRNQAIYGFTGADSDAVGLLVSEFRCRQLPLTVSYRCPKSVVKKAQQYVSHIQSADTATDGKVSYIPDTDFASTEFVAKRDTILCRKTAPLVKLAFQLIKRGVGCHVEGRDIGSGLLSLTKMWKVRAISVFLDRLDTWYKKQASKLEAKKAGAALEILQDKVDCLKYLAEGCSDVDCIRNKIQEVFRDDGDTQHLVTLSTVHKAKGREWQNVYVYGANLWMPLAMAKKQWEMVQEDNLCYVAATRSMDTLTYVEVKRS